VANYRLHHIHHEAANVDAAVQFYAKNFQAVLEERAERNGVQWARMTLGDTLINITDRATTQVGLERYQGLDHFALHTSDFDETVATLQANGVHFWTEPTSPRPGVKVAFIAGPDNIKIELMHVSQS
jgi:catechol 2,3-dioxygenase-like lactoylglutathione lyase family enzyme